MARSVTSRRLGRRSSHVRSRPCGVKGLRVGPLLRRQQPAAAALPARSRSGRTALERQECHRRRRGRGPPAPLALPGADAGPRDRTRLNKTPSAIWAFARCPPPKGSEKIKVITHA